MDIIWKRRKLRNQLDWLGEKREFYWMVGLIPPGFLLLPGRFPQLLYQLFWQIQ